MFHDPAFKFQGLFREKKKKGEIKYCQSLQERQKEQMKKRTFKHDPENIDDVV